MSRALDPQPSLIVAADDYGYAPGYNRGILEAADAGAIDCASAMVVRRWCDPEPLLATGIEIGIHLEPPGDDLREQLDAFERLFGRPPAYLDGHHHCHARPDRAQRVARLAAGRRLPVRSVDERHRALLWRLGVPTPDRLVGRMESSEPALPALLDGEAPLPDGVTEWMVHPGHRDRRAGSSYDAAREEDLRLVLRLRASLARRARRTTHAAAFADG
jgi:predicted glycoside hydrolase/deacetylase ChbG (UPF0249 family)